MQQGYLNGMAYATGPAIPSQYTINNLGGGEVERDGGSYRVEENAATPAFRSESGTVYVENLSFSGNLKI